MNRVVTLIEILKKPKMWVRVLGDKKFFNWMPDKLYLKLIYRAETGKKLNFDNPKKFTEKLQWLKLNNKQPDYRLYVDKYMVREYIKKTIGDEYLIPLIKVYDKVDDIDWEILPQQFVIKCNHGSGSNIICTDKNLLNIDDAKKKLGKWMKKNWYWFGREWVYKDMEKKIIVEKYLRDTDQVVPKDYKFWTFNGKVKYINVHFKENNNTKINVYNKEWELQSFGMVYNSNLDIIHKKPKNFCKMVSLAEELADNIPFVRIDFYEVDNSIYFGEITFFPTSGFIPFHPNDEELDIMYGQLLSLENE